VQLGFKELSNEKICLKLTSKTFDRILDIFNGTAMTGQAKIDCPQKVRHYLGVFLWKNKLI
jgi:hypothetical protein